jgi:uncharacterized protein YdcH (DUF465 family)
MNDIKKIKELKNMQGVMRNDRIQNMKKPNVHIPETIYKRIKKVDVDE